MLVLTGVVAAQVFEAREFKDPENAQRYQTLINELRCLVCQNQNLADSNASLAADLRQLTYDMILDGKSDEEIIEFMVERYGDFVLYRPPLKPTTLMLWIGPLLLLVLGIWLLLRQLRRRSASPVENDALSADERARLERLLRDDEARSDPLRSD
ncbi:MAG: cytochrome c-type biogenesis protein CcmH [Gammaproteobacteria bacterium]|nr:cytochrome c-type biogenesis protein CcmH [Gammaproteobacteria bacterium]